MTKAKSLRKTSAVLRLSCPDRKGLVASLAGFILKYGGNILHADQSQDSENGRFLMRFEWDIAEFTLTRQGFAQVFKPLADQFDMTWELKYSDEKAAMAIFVSQFDHCLSDLLYRHRIGELDCDLKVIIGNHEGARELAEYYGIAFHFFPVTAATKAEVEAKQRTLLRSLNIDLVVLARYMQILSSDFVSEYRNRIVNIHHSFLPAFLGAKPYHRAFERGVKIIGTTSHYVTDQLDDGPIIEQDVIRISHRDQIEDLIRKGRDLEKVVLSRAVRWHLDCRILVSGNKTVIFA